MTVDEDRAEFAQYLVQTGMYWAGVRSNVPLTTPTGERLSGFTHSFLVALAGCAGAIGGHKLAPKDEPSLDLGGEHLNEVLYIDDLAKLEPRKWALIGELRNRVEFFGMFGDGHLLGMKRYVADLCRWLPTVYELRPLVFDDESGEVLSEGNDIGPGLMEEFETQWDRAMKAPQ